MYHWANFFAQNLQNFYFLRREGQLKTFRIEATTRWQLSHRLPDNTIGYPSFGTPSGSSQGFRLQKVQETTSEGCHGIRR